MRCSGSSSATSIGNDSRSIPNSSARLSVRSAPRGPHSRSGSVRPCKRHRAHQADDADHVVGVKVREEDVLETERNAVAHHLPLGALAAVEQQGLAFAHDGEEATLRSTVGREAEVPRRRMESDMGAKYSPGGARLALVEGPELMASE